MKTQIYKEELEKAHKAMQYQSNSKQESIVVSDVLLKEENQEEIETAKEEEKFAINPLLEDS